MKNEQAGQIFRDIVTELQDAAQHLDFARAETATDHLISMIRHRGAGIPEAEALEAFRTLRRKRWFEPMMAVVETYLQCVPAPQPLVQTLYAQALIDQDQLTAGIAMANEALRAAPRKSKAAEEARGLIGRAHKQAFVRASDPRSPHARTSLRLSAQAYSQAHAKAVKDPCWPAVNLLALAARARADRLDLGVKVNVRRLGGEVLEKVEAALKAAAQKAAKEGGSAEEMPWLLASAFEACLALRRDREALGWFKRYLACRTTDAFDFGSTARQLREVWRLERHSNRKIALALPVLEAALLKKTGGKLDNPLRMQRTVSGRVLQAIFGEEHFTHRQWLEEGLSASDKIVRIEDVNGAPKGTGFVVRGHNLRNEWGDQPLVMTNAHVVGDPAPRNGVHWNRAKVRFTTRKGADANPGVRVKGIVHRDETLDFALLSLIRRPDPDTVLDIGGPENLSLDPPPSRICVVGHPGGRDISYSIYDNELRDLATPNIFYTSPTQAGSSGSPLFDPDWRVVGLHCGEDTARKVNVGTLLNAVRAAIPG